MMMTRIPILIFILVFFMTGGCTQDLSRIPVLGDFRTSEEAQIAAMLADVHRGMESRRIYRVLSHMSRSYLDAEGRDYKAMEAYLNDIFRTYRDIRIERADPRIVVDGDRARVLETFATRAEPFPGTNAVPFHLAGQMMVYLVKVDGEWKIIEWGHLN